MTGKVMILTPGWLNKVKRFLRDLLEQQLGCGVFRSVREWEQVIMGYIDKQNEVPEPIIRAKSAGGILGVVKPGDQTLDKSWSVRRDWFGRMAVLFGSLEFSVGSTIQSGGLLVDAF